MSDVGPQLTRLVIGDDPDAWGRAGFRLNADDSSSGVAGPYVQVGSVSIVLTGSDTTPRGIGAWAFDAETADVIDGLLTLEHPVRSTVETAPHPNGVTSFDHLVVMSPDGDRTTAALRSVGMVARRTRSFESGAVAMRQTFLWMGDVILELVAPDSAQGAASAHGGASAQGADSDASAHSAQSANGTGPAQLWGLAFVVDDLDATVAALGERSSAARAAVQPGRRIASLRHKALDITVPIAFMTPHVRTD